MKIKNIKKKNKLIINKKTLLYNNLTIINK